MPVIDLSIVMHVRCAIRTESPFCRGSPPRRAPATWAHKVRTNVQWCTVRVPLDVEREPEVLACGGVGEDVEYGEHERVGDVVELRVGAVALADACW